MLALLLATLLAAQDPAPKPYTSDWKPSTKELIELLDKETQEPKLRYLLGRAKKLGAGGVSVLEHAVASENAWLRCEALTELTALGADAKSALPGLVKRLSACDVRDNNLWVDEQLAKLQEGVVPTRDGPKVSAEAEARALAAAVGSIGKSDPKALEIVLAPSAPSSFEHGWSVVHVAFALAMKGNASAASELFLARWKSAPTPERLLLLAGCARVDLEPGAVADQLVATLSDSSADLRRAACSIVVHQKRLDPRTFAAPLRKLLTEPVPSVRLMASTSLIRIGDTEACAEILRLVSCPEDAVAIGAGSVVALIARSSERKDLNFPPLPTNVVDILTQVATSKRSLLVRSSAVEALEALGDRAAGALPILKTLATTDDLVGWKARDAVRRIEGKDPK